MLISVSISVSQTPAYAAKLDTCVSSMCLLTDQFYWY